MRRPGSSRYGPFDAIWRRRACPFLEGGVNTANILLRGNHPRLTSMLKQALLRIGYHVASFDKTQPPTVAIAQHQPDLILVDDLTVCRLLCDHSPTLPIVFYSSCADPRQIVQAMDNRSDDYIVVPFAREEFAARIRVLLRRTAEREIAPLVEGAVLQSTDAFLVLNTETYRVRVNGKEVHLTKTEFRLLHYLLSHADTVLTYRFLLETVWGPEYDGMDEYIRVYIRRLRQKIEPDPTHPKYILTKLNHGYLFRQPQVL